MSSEPFRITPEAPSKAIPRPVGFTVESLNRASCKAGKTRRIIRDGKTPGLGLRITSAGAKTFVYYAWVNGRPLLMKLGSFPAISIDQARKMAAGVHADVANGVDPMEQRRSIRSSITLQELFDKYDTEHTALRGSQRTRITDQSRFDTCFADWKSRSIATILPSQVKQKHVDLARARGKVTANRAVQLLRRMLNYADVVPNPAATKSKGKGVIEYFDEVERERFLQPAELQRLFAALESPEVNPTIRDYVKVSLFSGARRSNVQSMRWDEIDFPSKVWTIPAAKSKNGKPMKVPLVQSILDVLDARKGNGTAYVFPAAGKRRSKTPHLVEPRWTWKKLLRLASITDLHPHDLRRTMASYQAAIGSSLQVIGASLGHADPATTMIYSRLNLDTVRASVNAAADAMAKAAAPAPAAAK